MSRKSQLDRDIVESLASKEALRGRDKPPTYTVQPRNLWRTWNFSTLPDAVAFGFTLGEPFDVSTNSGEVVWGWAQRPPSEAEVWGEKHRSRHHAAMKGGAKARALELSPTLEVEKYRPFSKSTKVLWWVHLPGSVTSLGEGPTEAKAWQAVVLRLEGVKSPPGLGHSTKRQGEAGMKNGNGGKVPSRRRLLFAHYSDLESFARQLARGEWQPGPGDPSLEEAEKDVRDQLNVIGKSYDRIKRSEIERDIARVTKKW